MIQFIDEHKDLRSGTLRWGIESIAKIIGIAPSTYHAAKKRLPSARAVRDAELRPQILQVYEENLAVYGADKIWDQLNKDEVRVARCTVERLMRHMGIQGCRRGRVWVKTTVGDDALGRPADLVDRNFTAPAPNRLWVADLTYVKTHSGWVYVAFIVDVFAQRILAWHCATTKHVELVATPLRIALWDRDRQGHTVGPDELICHSDAGSQYTAIRFTEHLALEGISPSIGSVGDAYDNALMETIKCRHRHLMLYADVWIMPTVTTFTLVRDDRLLVVSA